MHNAFSAILGLIAPRNSRTAGKSALHVRPAQRISVCAV